MANDKTQHMQGKVTPGATPSLDDLSTQMIMSKSSTIVGQIAIVGGLGIGTRLPVYAGTNALGRETGKNRLVVDFGDTMIGRSQHALITYEAATKAFGIQGTGHPNPIVLNGRTVTEHVPIVVGDQFKIGQTTFELVS